MNKCQAGMSYGAPSGTYTISRGLPSGYSIAVYFKLSNSTPLIDANHDGITDPGEYDLEIDRSKTKVLYMNEDVTGDMVDIGITKAGKLIVTA